MEPYTKNRLNALPFVDIIRDYKVISDGVVPENPLKFLYPDIPKDEAFGRLYNSQRSKGKSGKTRFDGFQHLFADSAEAFLYFHTSSLPVHPVYADPHLSAVSSLEELR